jgi:hypothetical protein
VTNIKGLKKDPTKEEGSIFLKQLNEKGMKDVLTKNIEDDIPLRGRKM